MAHDRRMSRYHVYCLWFYSLRVQRDLGTLVDPHGTLPWNAFALKMLTFNLMSTGRQQRGLMARKYYDNVKNNNNNSYVCNESDRKATDLPHQQQQQYLRQQPNRRCSSQASACGSCASPGPGLVVGLIASIELALETPIWWLSSLCDLMSSQVPKDVALFISFQAAPFPSQPRRTGGLERLITILSRRKGCCSSITLDSPELFINPCP